VKSTFSRRDMLKTAPGLVALLSVGTRPAAAAQTGSASAAQAASTPASGAAFDSIDRALQQVVDKRAVAGVVAMGATQEGVIYEGAYGARNPQTREAMTPDTIFWLLSMTKAITATACMQLVDKAGSSSTSPPARSCRSSRHRKCSKASMRRVNSGCVRRAARSRSGTC
jgi:methyl acetate hydrolase